MESSKKQGLLYVHLAVLLFGGAGLFGKLVQNIPAAGIVTARALIASLVLGVLMTYRKEDIKLQSSKSLIGFMILGSILALHWTAFYQSVISSGKVAIAVLTFACFPAFTILLAPIFERKKLEISKLVLATLSFLGTYIIFPNFNWYSSYNIGILWGLLSALSFALLTLLNKRLLDKTYSSNQISLFQNLFAGLILAPFFMVDIYVNISINWPYLLLLGSIFTALSHTLFIKSMNYIKAEQASLIANLEPVYGIFAAYLILGEEVSLRTLCGGGLILIVALYVSVESTSNN